jgi:hypothetical protein
MVRGVPEGCVGRAEEQSECRRTQWHCSYTGTQAARMAATMSSTEEDGRPSSCADDTYR